MSEHVSYVVSVRSRGDAYHARCEGLTASCTSDAETAALRAAAKAFARCFAHEVAERDITLTDMSDRQPAGGLVRRNWTFVALQVE